MASSRWQLGELGGSFFDLAQRQPVCRHGQVEGAVKAERSEFFLHHISFCHHKIVVDFSVAVASRQRFQEPAAELFSVSI